MIYQERDDGMITNLYHVKLINKTNQHMNVKFELLEPVGSIEIIGEQFESGEQ